MYMDLHLWDSQQEKEYIIGFNGGGIYYDSCKSGFKPIPEQKRIEVLEASWIFQDTLKKIFASDNDIIYLPQA